MGIRFTDSLLSLLTAALGVAIAYFAGHGLSEMTAWPWIAAAGSLVAAVLVGAFTVRRIRSHAAGRDRTGAH